MARFHATTYGNIPFTVDEELEADIEDANWSAEQQRLIVPQSITSLQGELAIDAAGMATAYLAWIKDPARTFAEQAFIKRAITWNRNDPLMIGAATALGLTDVQLDDLFILAATL